jgi:hypothetical protein
MAEAPSGISLCQYLNAVLYPFPLMRIYARQDLLIRQGYCLLREDTCGLTKPSAETNRPPIVVIFSLISIETVFKRLSKVRLLGSSNGSDNPHDFINFLLNCKSVEKDNDAMTCWNQGETIHTYNKTSKDYGGRV